MNNKINTGPEEKLPDLKHLIKSIQRIEGNPDCFGTIGEACDRLDCAWYTFCCKETQKDR